MAYTPNLGFRFLDWRKTTSRVISCEHHVINSCTVLKKTAGNIVYLETNVRTQQPLNLSFEW